MGGTRTGDKNAAFRQKTQRPLVDEGVALQSALKTFLIFYKSGRIQNDHIEAAFFQAVFFEQIENVLV